MKALMVALAAFLFRGSLIVNFQCQNSSYRVGQEHPQYADIKAMLEKAQKVNQKLKVIAIIPSMTIQKIEGIKV